MNTTYWCKDMGRGVWY